MTTNMKTHGTFSTEAQRILAEGPVAYIERSAENLPQLRSNTRAQITPAVERAIQDTGVTTEEASINGIKCLVVTPPFKTAHWPILYCFGGGFVQGSPFEDMGIAAPLSAITGAKVIMPNYRLAPEHPWPAAVEDGFAVYKHVAEQPFALVGESAGGNLALSLMLNAKDVGLPLPRVSGLLSPWCDLTNSGDSLTANDGVDPTLRLQDVQAAAAHYAHGHDLSDPHISPINGAFDANFPPCIITSGTRDLLLSQAIDLTKVLQSHDVPVDLQIWDGLWHVFEWDDHIPEARQSLTNIAAFLAFHMNG
ncbi:Monoterpene epsilon-lactone hydrolase [Roseovarius albus]|uniref:Monoterpene epsilon-lactone hydrolase n=1 Tax=Roseovarius albus TaxID=1247867 RepID=A0A1X6ZZ92_9RHOB|nr:alpha/beta hydrolase [Roseovarius albus]SLN65982.1 Monoterpene epsilon-lactone hydrolase [Roseovarius albus]